MNVALFSKDEISGIHYQRGRGFASRMPRENRTYEYYGDEPKLLHYASGNPFEGDVPGARDTLRGSQWVFTRRSWGRDKKIFVTKMGHHYQNIPTIGKYLSATENKWWISKFQSDAKFSPHTSRRLYERAQGFADITGKPVAIPSPKSLNRTVDAENEFVIVFPTNKIIINKNLAPGIVQRKFYLKDMPRRKFEGFDRGGTMIVSYDFAKKPAQKYLGLNPNPTFFIKNAAETYKDLRLSKDFKLYFDSRARYDAASGILKVQRMTGVLPMSAMSAGAYGTHSTEHYQSVAKNMRGLKAGSLNPKYQSISDDLIENAALFHDSIKLRDKETMREHGRRAGFLIQEGYFDKVIKQRGISDADKFLIAHAVSRHTRLNPGIISTIKYRPKPLDKLLVTGDRMDLVRYGMKPNPKRLFTREILDEPWSWSSGQLMPPAPKRGSFKMPDVRSPELKGEITEPKIRDSGYYLSSQSQMSGALGGALGINAARGRQRESFTKENKKDTSERLKDKYTKKDEKYFEEYYKDKSSSRGGYYGRERDYGYRERYRGDYGYGRIKEYPRGYDFFKGYSSTYKIEPKYYAGEYKRIDYLQPSSYVMGSKYKGNPYKNTKYNLGAYPSKTTIQPQPKETPIRIKTKDKPKESKKERYRKITLENVEIPIVRAEDVLFSKDIGVLELPANKKTLYEFGNVLSTKKPSVKKRKRRSQ